MTENERIAREVLANTREQIAPEINQELLDKVYDIEIKHQFARERAAVIDLISNLVDEAVKSDDELN